MSSRLKIMYLKITCCTRLIVCLICPVFAYNLQNTTATLADPELLIRMLLVGYYLAFRPVQPEPLVTLLYNALPVIDCGTQRAGFLCLFDKLPDRYGLQRDR